MLKCCNKLWVIDFLVLLSDKLSKVIFKRDKKKGVVKANNGFEKGLFDMFNRFQVFKQGILNWSGKKYCYTDRNKDTL